MLLTEGQRLLPTHHDERRGHRVRVHGALPHNGGAGQVGLGGQSRFRVENVVVEHAVLLKAALIYAAGHDGALSHGDHRQRAARVLGVAHAYAEEGAVRLLSHHVYVAAEVQQRTGAAALAHLRQLVGNVALGNAAKVDHHARGQRNLIAFYF